MFFFRIIQKYMWHRKLTLLEKKIGNITSEKKRKIISPYMCEINADIEGYCTKRNLSQEVCQRITNINKGHDKKYDTRDLRTLKKCDRIPRSLEHRDRSPERYWDIFI